MKIDRRDFVRILGTAVGGAALASTGITQFYEIPEKLLQTVANGPGIIKWKSTICGMCPAGCGLNIKTVDGLPIYVKGNPNFPVNSGGVCPAAHGSLEQLFHPERLKTPLKKTISAEGTKFEPISWNDALKIVRKKIIEIRKAGNPERFAFLGEGNNTLSMKLASEFTESFGSPNFFEFSFNSNQKVDFILQGGIERNPTYDIPNANIILTLGANILETDLSPIFYTKLLSNRKNSDDKRIEHIHVNSRQDLTGMFANTFVPIKHETIGAFALGLAYVLIREEMIDTKFISKNTLGYENWNDDKGNSHKGYKNYILENYYPEKVSEITGVSSATILNVARQIGNNNPAIVIGGDILSESVNGVFTQMAVNSLNAILGNFGKKGGVILIPELISDSKVASDSTSREGLKNSKLDSSGNNKFLFSSFSISQFAKNINEGFNYPLEMLFMYKGNPLFQSLNKHELTEAIKKIPLVISFDSFINESNKFADIILPIHCFLEEWDIVSEASGVPFHFTGIRQPIVEKFHDTRQMSDILIELSRDIGGAPSKTFKVENFQMYLKDKMNNIYQSGLGAVTSRKIEGHWLEFIKKRGWHLGRYQSFDDFWELLIEKGGWWNPDTNPIKTEQMFDTKSNKFEFYSTRLAERINSSQNNGNSVLSELSINAKGDVVFLPHFEVPTYNKEKPLSLMMFRNNINNDGSNSNLPLLQELFGIGVRHYWGTWVEINQKTSDKYNIIENEDVWISSEYGSIKARVRIIPSLPDSVVAIPFGMGHTNYGKYADGFGSNPTRIIKNQYDMLSGKPAYQSTKVSISKIK